MKRLVVHLFLIVGVAGLVSSSFAASLQKEAWPAETACPACFHLQVRDLDLQLPIAQVHGAFSTGSQIGDVSIVPPSGHLGKDIAILNKTWEDLVALFKGKPLILEQHGIHNLKDFFTALGNDSAPADKFMTAVRKAYNLDTATGYRRMERNGLTAFIVDNPDPNPTYQRIIFLVDGSNVYYEVFGNPSEEMISVILANGKVNKMP